VILSGEWLNLGLEPQLSQPKTQHLSGLKVSVVNPFFFSLMSRELELERSRSRCLSGPSRFLIRGAVSGDLMQLAEILALSFHSREGIGSFIYPVLRLGIYEDLKNRLRSASEHYICLAAELVPTRPSNQSHLVGGECLAGTVEMALRSHHPWSMSNSEYPYLSNLAVHPDCRRLGVAQKLLNNCEHIALEWGFSDIYLHVLENNQPARKLYNQAGYRLHQVDWNWTCLFLGQPRRLFLRKHLISDLNT
jgi:ribosomal protein S18 acetylase RimI-like enzyme